jgi:hypothetical protein
MKNNRNPKPEPDGSMVYQIRIKGHLSPQWTDWFEGLTIALEDNGDTLLSGPVVDQAALHGLLRKVRDLGMPLLSVIQSERGEQMYPDSEGEAPRTKSSKTPITQPMLERRRI